MPTLRFVTLFTLMLVPALMALSAGYRALDLDEERDKGRNAGGNGSLFREAGAPGSG